jgi:hypothetical protein
MRRNNRYVVTAKVQQIHNKRVCQKQFIISRIVPSSISISIIPYHIIITAPGKKYFSPSYILYNIYYSTIEPQKYKSTKLKIPTTLE